MMKWNSLREGADPKMMWADSKTKNENKRYGFM
jgi:hypothetical protein